MEENVEPKKRLGKIAFVLDEKISWDRAKVLTQTINILRRDASIELLRGATTEEELLIKHQTEKYKLIILPWHRYFEWIRLDSHLGKNRSSGPTTCGYMAEPISAGQLPDKTSMQRTVLLDFHGLKPNEIRKIVSCIVLDSNRSGIRSLLNPGTTIFCENWYQQQGQGERADILHSLKEFDTLEWKNRNNSIRIVMMALWSMVYEHGPGKREISQGASANAPRAYFQIGVDSSSLMFKLFFPQPGWKTVDVISHFWPGRKENNHTYSLLLEHADFFRIHTIANAPEIEVVAGFFPSKPAQEFPGKVHTLWIEPIQPGNITERPFEAPSPRSPHLKPLPAVSQSDPKPHVLKDEISKVKDHFITEANTKIRDLQKLLAKKDECIQELRTGGVGTAPSLPSQDIEGLLETFQQLYFDARYQIRQFEVQINKLEETGNPDPKQVAKIKNNMNVLIEREKNWIRFIADTMKIVREKRG